MNTQQVLEKAADLAERAGHCKGRMYNEGWSRDPIGEPTECCLLGAYSWSTSAENRRSSVAARERIYQVIGERYRGNMGGWNDLPTTTKEDVVNVLRHAARLAGESGS